MGWLPGSGCALWIQMDARPGNIAYDLSRNNNHATIYGASWTRGKIGYALSFDGIDDYVDCGNDPSIRITGTEITLECWVKFIKAINAHIISKADACYMLGTFNDKAEMYLWTSDGVFTNRDVPGGTILTTGVWYYLVDVYDGANIITYVNGREDRRLTGVSGTILDSATIYLNLGRRVSHKDWYLSGLIDEARIYNRALSVKEIEARYWYGIIPSLRVPPVAVR